VAVVEGLELAHTVPVPSPVPVGSSTPVPLVVALASAETLEQEEAVEEKEGVSVGEPETQLLGVPPRPRLAVAHPVAEALWLAAAVLEVLAQPVGEKDCAPTLAVAAALEGEAHGVLLGLPEGQRVEVAQGEPVALEDCKRLPVGVWEALGQSVALWLREGELEAEGQWEVVAVGLRETDRVAEAQLVRLEEGQAELKVVAEGVALRSGVRVEESVEVEHTVALGVPEAAGLAVGEAEEPQLAELDTVRVGEMVEDRVIRPVPLQRGLPEPVTEA